jgi:polyisoprenoid-binding protein YceI
MVRALTTVVIVALLTTLAQAGETKIALSGDNTKVTFVGTKPKGRHEGGFKTLTGTATVNGTDPATLKIAVEFDINSMYTDTAKLTNHLKSPDFFDVKTYPKAKFESSKVAKSAEGYTVTGKLTMHGKTKELSFPARIDFSGGTLQLTSNFKINRQDWGISYGKGIVDDQVSLTVAVKAK